MRYMFSGCSNQFIKRMKERYKNLKEEAFY